MDDLGAFDRHERPGAILLLRRGLGDLASGARAWLENGEAFLGAAAGRVAGTGRCAARRLALGDRQAVWRRNRHGGFLGGLQGDRYLGAGRLLREVALSEALRAQRIPTPPVLLALAVRRGAWWRQHLVTEAVAGACTVFTAREDPAALEAARTLLERLFEAGLWASDLHPDNLLWQSRTGACHVIDLAGARLLGRPLSGAEREARLRRFRRYFRKHAGAVPPAFSLPVPSPGGG